MEYFRNIFKKIVFGSPVLRKIFIFVYKIRGRKSWSLGYSIYKFGYIKNIIENHLDFFQKTQLPLDYGLRLDERVVEYPWFFSKLKVNEKVILDAGSTLNHVDILSLDLLKDRKLYISTLSYEGFPRVASVPSYVFEDIRNMCHKDGLFDAVACISTLEHVGMDNSFLYTSDTGKKENNKYAFLAAINEFKRVLKENGTLYLTVPYGRYKSHEWLQVFDSEMVEQIKDAFSPTKVTEPYFKYENGQWNFSNAQACRDGYYFDIHNEKKLQKDYLAASQSIICAELTK